MTALHRPPPGKYRLTVNDFIRLDEDGVFGTSRTELLDGDIIIMNAEYRPHGRIVGEVWYLLRRALERIDTNLHVQAASVDLSDHDMPLPDALLTTEPDGEEPVPRGSVALVVEVSATTLDRDLGDKQIMYAKAGIAEYWVIDVETRALHQMWTPTSEGYADRRRLAFGDPLTAVTIEHLSIDTAAF